MWSVTIRRLGWGPLRNSTAIRTPTPARPAPRQIRTAVARRELRIARKVSSRERAARTARIRPRGRPGHHPAAGPEATAPRTSPRVPVVCPAEPAIVITLTAFKNPLIRCCLFSLFAGDYNFALIDFDDPSESSSRHICDVLGERQGNDASIIYPSSWFARDIRCLQKSAIWNIVCYCKLKAICATWRFCSCKISIAIRVEIISKDCLAAEVWMCLYICTYNIYGRWTFRE